MMSEESVNFITKKNESYLKLSVIYKSVMITTFKSIAAGLFNVSLSDRWLLADMITGCWLLSSLVVGCYDCWLLTVMVAGCSLDRLIRYDK